ncbi:hypothetical protein [uncultured Ruminococcus sp.]|uniref:hypothetical protein n=1 Tax=uncultured Ruminococcus sp. TaxID=165186 RepID=UPI002930202A|nr:hypothetical protein [uncultured Ruminococcus sp.]
MSNEKEKNNSQDSYPFEIRDNCLYVTTVSKRGSSTAKVCNFVPRIVSEKTVDDGAVTEKTLVLSGIHADGSTLPPVEVNGADLSNFNWLLDKWGAKCIIEVGQRCKDHLRYYIQTTSEYAEQLTEYHVTGWKKIDGEWHFLLPGDDSLNVVLKGKLQHYCGESNYDLYDLIDAYNLYKKPPASSHIIQPLVAFAFLTPLNEFLRQAGCMPKFVLFITGRTGTRKSTIAALILSFFGQFSSTDLPMSFRDTANSIIANSFSLKDVLTCIDDFYPSDNAEMKKLNTTAQTVMRAYGDRTGRARLRSDSTLMESRPPQGNAIITGELSPDIGESGTARYFTLELKEEDVDLGALSVCQSEAADGAYRRTMYAYTQWLKRRYLCDDDHVEKLRDKLLSWHKTYRNNYYHHNQTCHGRLPEIVACLMIGMRFFLQFLKENCVIKQEDQEIELELFRKELYALADQQSTNVEHDKPVNIFIRKLYSLIEGGKVMITERNRPDNFDPYPPGYIGCQDEEYYYLNKDLAHSAVKKMCAEQGESFPVSAKALVKALAEEKLIKTTASGNTVSVRYCGKNMRFIALDKSKAEQVLGTE